MFEVYLELCLEFEHSKSQYIKARRITELLTFKCPLIWQSDCKKDNKEKSVLLPW